MTDAVLVRFVPSPGGTDDARRYPREPISCQVVWDHRRCEGEQGQILDVSPSGLFLSAPWGVPDYLRQGDVVWGRIVLGDREHVFSATVRWRGFSRNHGCSGIGLQFDELSQLAEQDLRSLVRITGRDPIAPPW